MWEDPEEAFKELDVKEFSAPAETLGAYLKALMKAGFTRRESIRLVEAYSKFLYDMAIEEFMAMKRLQEDIELPIDEDDQEEDVDDLDDDDVQ